jgi:hypothetical protein
MSVDKDKRVRLANIKFILEKEGKAYIGHGAIKFLIEELELAWNVVDTHVPSHQMDWETFRVELPGPAQELVREHQGFSSLDISDLTFWVTGSGDQMEIRARYKSWPEVDPWVWNKLHRWRS